MLARRLVANGISSGRKYGDDEEVSMGFVDEEKPVSTPAVSVVVGTRAVAEGEILVRRFGDVSIPCRFCQLIPIVMLGLEA
jgi:hypothetical protein